MSSTVIQQGIEEKLQTAFSPYFLTVVNESNNHNVPAGSESHFKVTMASDEFEGKRLIGRHRAINSVLADELNGKIHALALHTYTVSEWQKLNPDQVPTSPNCMGGEKGDEA
jgi:BolA protein